MNWQSTRESQGSETTLYDSLMVHTYHYASVQTHSMYNTKSEPEGKPWTLGDYDVSMQVRQLQQMYHLEKDVDNGEGHVCVDAAGVWEIFLSSPQFCCEPETTLKNKVFKKKIR